MVANVVLILQTEQADLYCVGDVFGDSVGLRLGVKSPKAQYSGTGLAT